jgi:hypothetical protein
MVSMTTAKASAERRYRGFVIEQVNGPFQDDSGNTFRFGGWRAGCPQCERTIGGLYQSDLRERIKAHLGLRAGFLGIPCELLGVAR